LEATISLVRERHADVLKRGAILIDNNDDSIAPRLLFYIEAAVQDGVLLPNGSKRVISKNVHFVEVSEDGVTARAGYAPYLDYSAPAEAEQSHLLEYIRGLPWLTDIESIALSHAIAEIVPQHLQEVRSRKERQVAKVSQAVKERLSAEITHWGLRTLELKEREAAGKNVTRLNWQLAASRTEELENRLQKRLDELALERLVSAVPPLIIGGAVVIPRGLLHRLLGRIESDSYANEAEARRSIELAAMQAVMEQERTLGYTPRDVSSENCGYDIESLIPEELRADDASPWRFIEVKGRAKGATTVTVTKNEILRAFNKPEEFILAIVEVDGEQRTIQYLRRPFTERPDFAATAVTYRIRDLLQVADHYSM